MKTPFKIALVTICVVSIAIWGYVGLRQLNLFLAERDLKRFLEKREYEPTFLYSLSMILKSNFSRGTPRNAVYENFKDCNKMNRFEITDYKDSLGSKFEEDYIYKLGLWGEIEIRAFYDSLSRLTTIDYTMAVRKGDID